MDDLLGRIFTELGLFMSMVIIFLILAVVGLTIGLTWNARDKSWAKKKAHWMIDRQHIDKDYWKVCNRLALIQGGDIEAIDLLKKLQDMKVHLETQGQNPISQTF